VQTRLPQADLERLQLAAQEQRTTPAHLLRAAVLDHLDEYFGTPPPPAVQKRSKRLRSKRRRS
jgi:hypothetical protein